MRRRKKTRIFPLILLIFICMGVSNAGLFNLRNLSGAAGVTQEVVGKIEEPQVPFAEMVIDELEVADGFYYRSLQKEQQLVYKEIFQGVRSQEETIYVHIPDAEELGRIYEFLLYDSPELFWCTGEMQITSYSDYAEIRPVYICQGEEWQQKTAQIEAAAEACLSGIAVEADEYDKVRYIFEYLVNTVDYNLDAPDNQNIYSALVNHSSVCAGYSRAAQYLLQKLGVECIYVIGTIPQQGAHAWNIVNCGGQYYQMDVTFGDPVFQEEENGGNVPVDGIDYGYLCCADAEIYKTHTPDETVAYPPCTSMDLNYYVLNGMYYETYDGNVILQEMNQSIYAMERSFTCKFPGDDIYSLAHDDIINNLIPQAAQTLASFYGLETVWYTYVEDSVMDAITVYWSYQ